MACTAPPAAPTDIVVGECCTPLIIYRTITYQLWWCGNRLGKPNAPFPRQVPAGDPPWPCYPALRLESTQSAAFPIDPGAATDALDRIVIDPVTCRRTDTAIPPPAERDNTYARYRAATALATDIVTWLPNGYREDWTGTDGNSGRLEFLMLEFHTPEDVLGLLGQLVAAADIESVAWPTLPQTVNSKTVWFDQLGAIQIGPPGDIYGTNDLDQLAVGFANPGDPCQSGPAGGPLAGAGLHAGNPLIPGAWARVVQARFVDASGADAAGTFCLFEHDLSGSWPANRPCALPPCGEVVCTSGNASAGTIISMGGGLSLRSIRLVPNCSCIFPPP